MSCLNGFEWFATWIYKSLLPPFHRVELYYIMYKYKPVNLIVPRCFALINPNKYTNESSRALVFWVKKNGISISQKPCLNLIIPRCFASKNYFFSLALVFGDLTQLHVYQPKKALNLIVPRCFAATTSLPILCPVADFPTPSQLSPGQVSLYKVPLNATLAHKPRWNMPCNKRKATDKVLIDVATFTQNI